ncbi:MAG: hypothetical protein HEQ23_13215 [Tepidisphaera sp.]
MAIAGFVLLCLMIGYGGVLISASQPEREVLLLVLGTISAVSIHAVVHLWFKSTQRCDVRTAAKNRAAAIKRLPDPDEIDRCTDEYRKRFDHADNIMHQRMNLSLVAQAATLAGVAEIWDKNLTAVVLFCLAGLVLNLVSASAVLVIGRRTDLTLFVLARLDRVHLALKNGGSLKFPTGSLLQRHVLPAALSCLWILTITCALGESRTGRDSMIEQSLSSGLIGCQSSQTDEAGGRLRR